MRCFSVYDRCTCVYIVHDTAWESCSNRSVYMCVCADVSIITDGYTSSCTSTAGDVPLIITVKIVTVTTTAYAITDSRK
jgi:hypothetical protein